MRIARALSELATETSPSVVTIGNFDGVHCGHRMVIAAVLERARALNARSCVVTFDPHPAHVLHEGPPLPLLTPLPEKLKLLDATGLDVALVLPFTEKLRCWTAHQFAERVLRDGLHAAEVHEGETFRFGHRARTDIGGLAEIGREFGFSVRAYEPLLMRGAAVSSSRIRALLATGEVAQARALLGRPFGIRSAPAPGRGYGSRYAVPTINLAPYAGLLPGSGVYITTLRVGAEGSTGAEDAEAASAGRVFCGVTNVGNRPTFGADSFAVETHLLDFEPIALSAETPLELTFLIRLRDEQRFYSSEALRAQIGADVRRAQRYFACCKALQVRLD